GLRTSLGTKVDPAQDAISMTPTPDSGNSTHVAWTFWPTGPVTVSVCDTAPWRCARISTVPSPPSGTGKVSTREPGSTRRMPAAIASATSIAERDSLNPEGATRIRSGAYNIRVTP